MQELFAGLGIAIGVALAFAVLVANSSITGSANEITRGLFGAGNLQLTARGPQGFDEHLTERARQLPGVVNATGVLEQRGIVVGPSGREVVVQVAGADLSLVALGGVFTRSFATGGIEGRQGMLIPSALADTLGLPATYEQARTGQPMRRVSLHVRGRASSVRVAAVLGQETIGPLADSMGVVAALSDLQRLTGLSGRVTRIVVQSQPGRDAAVRARLADLAGDTITVSSIDADGTLLEQATRPSDQATTFFAVISALVGFLLAFNAMLLTAPDRRQTVAELRIQGFRPRQVAQMLLFEAAVLGIAASVLGLVVGNLLARGIFHETPDYLASAFGFGTQTIVTFQPLVISFVGGVAATCVAASAPLLDLRSSRAIDAVYRQGGEPGHAVGARTHRRLLVSAIALLALTSGLVLTTPSAALPANVALAFATVLVIPSVFAGVLRTGEFLLARVRRLSLAVVALFALRATSLRALALAATGAVAVFGTVAVAGAREDLLYGIERYIRHSVDAADLWIANPADAQATRDIARGDLLQRVAATPGVARVRTQHGGFLDFAGRRVWVIARPAADRAMIPESEVVAGDPRLVAARLRQGGWITISQQIAADRAVEPGDTLAVPTPTGTVGYRVAATTTNLGWPPGAIVLNSADYRSGWATADPTAFEVDVRPGEDLNVVKGSLQDALGPEVALRVQTTRERADEAIAQTRQGLERLGQISTLLLIAASLAMASAMGASIWQRRAALAALRLQSFRPSQLARVLLLEAGLMVGAGCMTGALAGVYGQALIDRYLRLTTGFPAPFTPAGWLTAETFLLVFAAALAVVAVPAYLAAHAPPRLGLQE